MLELGKDAQHLKHRLAGRRGRIETLLMQKQVDAERVKHCVGVGGDRLDTCNRLGFTSDLIDEVKADVAARAFIAMDSRVDTVASIPAGSKRVAKTD